MSDTAAFLLHIRPRFFANVSHLEAAERDDIPKLEDIQLDDLTVEPFGLKLRGGMELATRRPYPNRNYLVACRRQATKKAVDGILLAFSSHVDHLHVTARWSIGAQLITTHRIHYQIIDRNFDFGSDDKTLWYGFGEWSNRAPAWVGDQQYRYRVERDIKMELVGRLPIGQEPISVLKRDRFAGGFLMERRQELPMPTIERGRLVTYPDVGRKPHFDSCFYVK
jgi:hypothetical protein